MISSNGTNGDANGDEDGLDPNTQDTLTQYTYDAGDRLTKVITPNNATTTYVYDDLGNLLKETSPDRGEINYTHDETGNVVETRTYNVASVGDWDNKADVKAYIDEPTNVLTTSQILCDAEGRTIVSVGPY